MLKKHAINTKEFIDEETGWKVVTDNIVKNIASSDIIDVYNSNKITLRKLIEQAVQKYYSKNRIARRIQYD